MTYSTPELLLVGSAKTLVRGSSALPGLYTDDNPANCSTASISRDHFNC
jgi:hypothetical protein